MWLIGGYAAFVGLLVLGLYGRKKKRIEEQEGQRRAQAFDEFLKNMNQRKLREQRFQSKRDSCI